MHVRYYCQKESKTAQLLSDMVRQRWLALLPEVYHRIERHLYTSPETGKIVPISSSRMGGESESAYSNTRRVGWLIGQGISDSQLLPSPSALVRWVSWEKRGHNNWDLQCCGRVSFHLFMEESNWRTTKRSHSSPTSPECIFDFFVEYKVLRVTAMISQSFNWQTKEEILQGFPGGCLNSCFGSPASQYSSSHSIG